MNSPVLTADELSLLDDVSDDAYGLWEVDWFFNGKCSQLDAGHRIEFLAALVEQGFIDVFFGRMGQIIAPLPSTDALVAVGHWDNWRPPETIDAPVYQVMTGEVGIAALRSHTSD